MAQKFIIKQKTGDTTFTELYPKTSADIVEVDSGRISTNCQWASAQDAFEDLYVIKESFDLTDEAKDTVNTLKEILDTFADVKDDLNLATELGNKLDKSGGRMTGDIQIDNNKGIKFMSSTGGDAATTTLTRTSLNITASHDFKIKSGLMVDGADKSASLYFLNGSVRYLKAGETDNTALTTCEVVRKADLGSYLPKENTTQITTNFKFSKGFIGTLDVTNLSVLNFSPTTLLTKNISASSGGVGFYYDETKAIWRYCSQQYVDIDTDGVYEVATKKYAAAKVTPKYFTATTDGETITPNTGTGAAFSAVSVNSEGIVTAYGQSIITGKQMDTGTLAEWGLYFSFID